MEAKPRKIINISGSVGITIPVDFARKQGVKIGDDVIVVCRDEDFVIVTQKKK